MKGKRFTEKQISSALRQAESRVPVSEICRKLQAICLLLLPSIASIIIYSGCATTHRVAVPYEENTTVFAIQVITIADKDSLTSNANDLSTWGEGPGTIFDWTWFDSTGRFSLRAGITPWIVPGDSQFRGYGLGVEGSVSILQSSTSSLRLFTGLQHGQSWRGPWALHPGSAETDGEEWVSLREMKRSLSKPCLGVLLGASRNWINFSFGYGLEHSRLHYRYTEKRTHLDEESGRRDERRSAEGWAHGPELHLGLARHRSVGVFFSFQYLFPNWELDSYTNDSDLESSEFISRRSKEGMPVFGFGILATDFGIFNSD